MPRLGGHGLHLLAHSTSIRMPWRQDSISTLGRGSLKMEHTRNSAAFKTSIAHSKINIFGIPFGSLNLQPNHAKVVTESQP